MGSDPDPDAIASGDALLQGIQRADGGTVEAPDDVGVDHGGFDALVAQVFLDLADVLVNDNYFFL